jgi:hypothetical protein
VNCASIKGKPDHSGLFERILPSVRQFQQPPFQSDPGRHYGNEDPGEQGEKPPKYRIKNNQIGTVYPVTFSRVFPDNDHGDTKEGPSGWGRSCIHDDPRDKPLSARTTESANHPSSESVKERAPRHS